MIDIHTHILPGLDDGSKSLEESVEMARIAAAGGTTDIVASPHASPQYQFDSQLVEQRIGEVQAAVGDTPRIHYGCEMHLTLDNIEDALRSPGKYSIDHRGYLLVEFSDFLIPKTVEQIFASLMRVGLRPIVAHPERNQLLSNRLPEIQNWVAQGVLMQVTALSFLGRFGKEAKRSADELMGHGLAHFVASDAHDPKWRNTDLAESRVYVDKVFGAEAAERVFEENQRAVLAGVPTSAVPMPVRKKKWFSW